jgi:5'-deoxynucleotidase YfbR-like HD superfamily hydrolase
MEQLNFIRNAGETRRFHTSPVLRVQNIAEHSWHVAMLLYFIFGQSEPGLTPTLLMAALVHDAAEHQVGDLPAPAKRTMDERLRRPGLEDKTDTPFRDLWGDMEQEILAGVQLDFEKFLEPMELQALKLCDALDGATYCVRERAMGNQLIAEPFHNFMNYTRHILVVSFPRSDERSHGDRHGDQVQSPKTPADVAWEVYDYLNDEWSKYDV